MRRNLLQFRSGNDGVVKELGAGDPTKADEQVTSRWGNIISE